MWFRGRGVTFGGVCTMECLGKHNFRIKEALSLKRNRSRKGDRFLLEGFREIYKALSNGYCCDYLFCSETYLEKEEFLVQEMNKQRVPTFQCSAAILQSLSYKEHYDNFIAVMRKKYLSKEEFLERKKNTTPFYLIVEQVEKPGNVGALLRIADGAGVDGVILCDPFVDLYNPNLIRASLGTVFTLPIWEASLNEVLSLVEGERWHVFATTPAATDMFFHQDFRVPLALAFGSEKDGLTSEWLNGRFTKIALPMRGQADSLNLSTAVAAVTYEVVRQRW